MRVSVLWGFAFAVSVMAQLTPDRSANEHWRLVRYGITAGGSAYVPLDSWTYPAFDRLNALGYIDLAYFGLRPWTRLACVKMLAQAEELIAGEEARDNEARSIYDALRREFAPDYRAATAESPAPHAEIDSLYQRSLGIVGTPINDSFHFGQTIINDFGRPYQEGYNQIAGLEARAEYGRFSLLVRGEHQYAPGRPAYSDTVRAAISVMDSNPIAAGAPIASSSAFRLIDANLSTNLARHEISIGKSELWWGPAQGGAFAFSNNAEPIYGFRINRVEPLQVPLLSKVLGPIRYDFIVGSLKGHTSPVGPWIQAEKVSFKPSPNFEFGLSRTIVFAGKDHVPLTFGSFWNSFTSFSNVSVETKFSQNDPGTRYTTFDFSYRLPFVRDWLTVYTDSMVHDDVSTLVAPRRAAFRPGIYLSHFPRLHRLDFRAEAVYTDFPTSRSQGGKFFFYEAVYHDAYTNKQFILGDWVGREGKGGQAWLNYHFSPQEMLQFSYRHFKSAPDFVPGGTTQNDFSVNAVRRINGSLEVNGFTQIEFWKAPILAAGLRKNLVLGVQFTFYPRLTWTRRSD
jgi:hypothetical protein